MTNSDNERLGLPDMSANNSTKREKPGTEPNAEPRDDSPGALREGDTGLGLPPQSPDSARVLSKSDEEIVLGKILEPDSGDIMDEPVFPLARLPKFLYSTTVLLVIISSALLIVLYLANGIIDLFNKIAVYPFWAACAWYSFLAIIVVVVLTTVIRLIILYLRLSRSPQIRIKDLDEFNNRQSVRKSLNTIAVARNELTRFVRAYGIGDNLDPSALIKLGFTTDEIDSLRRQRDVLLDPKRSPSAEEWIDNFQNRFLSIIDQAAERRARASALHTAAKTAVAPRGIFDTLIVLYSSFKLMGDICAIYNLRMSGLATAAVLVRAFVIAYLAGGAQDAVEKISDELYKHVAGIAGAVANFMTAKTAEAAANGFLVWRLGKTAITLARPIRR